jgi:hypothetical protein
MLVASVLTMLASAIASAQPSGSRYFLEGGLVVTHQNGASGTISETYVTAPGGATAGWTLGGGVMVGDHASVLVEWATTGWMKAVEPSRYFTTYHEARRDRFFTVAARSSFRIGGPVALEPLAGIVLTTEAATSQAEYTDPAVSRAPGPRVVHDLNAGFGPVVGADLRIGATRLSVIPSFRFMRNRITRGRYDTTPASPDVEVGSIYPGGHPAWTVRAGALVGLRW